ncbi:sulfatase family protein [Paenibacillus aceris]|uniref:Arylsulfatase A-like enzyme n=1 Tax=Paenibacillus aceris TaxID=869555 RepID=A0ABS4HYT3_9BACL|nr:sulfatase [Paenibacillus aceris]MBP1963099.1 arylsulfatase A-like enzyme [Paenibacillus aceris]NHW38781.1 sulfatase [Paenibacillus aceris]
MDNRPNILYIMSDDHAAHAMSCYGSKINQTPNLDRIANEGMRFDNCFCTNALCTPSRASILTGTYNHINGVRTLDSQLDGRGITFPKLLQQAGYQTAIIGKWHLGHGGFSDPTGFDYWNILPGQGAYHDPEFIEMGEEKTVPGYVTDLITDYSLQWMKQRDENKPFLLMCHHKAPHDKFEYHPKHAHLYENIDIPEPETFYDDYANRSDAAKEATCKIADMDRHLTETAPEHLTGEVRKKWNYQKFIKDYLRCIASIDENVGRLLDYLDEQGLADNTIVVYTSDQGFFLGDHGWYDKRFMYEESLRMPFLMRYPQEIKRSTLNSSMVLNVDFAPMLLDCAGVEIPVTMQGRSFRTMFKEQVPPEWRQSMYYRYWMHLAHFHIKAHYGMRTDRYKLIYYYAEALGVEGAIDETKPTEWELFDLERDPYELLNVYDHPDYRDTVRELKEELIRLRQEVKDDSCDFRLEQRP